MTYRCVKIEDEQFNQLMIMAMQLNNNLVAQTKALNDIKEALTIGFTEIVPPEDDEEEEVKTFG